MLATDRATLDRATATFAPEQIGRHRYVTPDGFVLWQGVRLARTGPMLYLPEEMPEIEQGDGAMIVVERDADVLFNPDAVLSFSGMAVTNDHPNSPVCPVTYKGVAVGTVLNPRRGDGIEADYLIGDLLITDAQAIGDIDRGKREVSAGYDVEVEQIKPGLGRQTKIVGNHVALVKRGRAGPSCAIQDEEAEMANPRKRTLIDRLRTAFKANDEAAFEEELETAKDELEGDDPQTVVVKIETAPAAAAEAPAATDDDPADPTSARLDAIEATLAKITEALAAGSAPAADEAAEGEKEGEEKPAADEDPELSEEVEKSAAMDAMAKAEVLAPGIKLPVVDSPTIKGAAIVTLKRQALKKGFAGDAKPHIEAVLGGRMPDFDTMKSGVVSVVFDAAAVLAKAANNASARPRPMDIPQGPMTAQRYQDRILERRKAAQASH